MVQEAPDGAEVSRSAGTDGQWSTLYRRHIPADAFRIGDTVCALEGHPEGFYTAETFGTVHSYAEPIGAATPEGKKVMVQFGEPANMLWPFPESALRRVNAVDPALVPTTILARGKGSGSAGQAAIAPSGTPASAVETPTGGPEPALQSSRRRRESNKQGKGEGDGAVSADSSSSRGGEGRSQVEERRPEERRANAEGRLQGPTPVDAAGSQTSSAGPEARVEPPPVSYTHLTLPTNREV